jgi:hypothetical protein
MIYFKLDGKQIEERMKVLKECCTSRCAYLFFPEINKREIIDYEDFSKDFKDKAMVLFAYKIIGRAMVLGVCEFQAVGGASCKLFRNDEDFSLVLSD